MQPGRKIWMLAISRHLFKHTRVCTPTVVLHQLVLFAKNAPKHLLALLSLLGFAVTAAVPSYDLRCVTDPLPNTFRNDNT